MAKTCSKLKVFFEVSEINLYPIKQQGSLLGFASCVVNGWFYFGGLAIHTDLPTRGLRLVYPTKKTFSGKQIPLYHPISKDAAEKVQIAITAEWERLINN